MGEVPLRLLFSKLYGYCTNKKTTVDECFDSGEWKLDFYRSLDQNEIAQWDEMLDLLGGTALSDNQDTVRWALEKSGLYTTRSMYRVLSHRGWSINRCSGYGSANFPSRSKSFFG